MESLYYYIVYPSGDRSKLTVVELLEACKYELSDYAVASRKEFTDKDEAVEYARKLATENDLIYYSTEGNDYLD